MSEPQAVKVKFSRDINVHLSEKLDDGSVVSRCESFKAGQVAEVPKDYYEQNPDHGMKLHVEPGSIGEAMAKLKQAGAIVESIAEDVREKAMGELHKLEQKLHPPADPDATPIPGAPKS